jgi:hypothetical protein
MKFMIPLVLLSVSIVAGSLAKNERKVLLRIDAESTVLREHDRVYHSSFQDKRESLLNR